MNSVLAVIGGLVSLFTLYKVFIEIVLTRSSKRREEYGITKKFIDDLYDEDIHPYIVEKGILALTGEILTVKEMRYLMKLDNPSKAINLRVNSMKFLQFSEDGGYSWKEKYQGKGTQKWGPLLFNTLYFILCGIGLFILFYGSQLSFHVASKAVLVAVFLLASFISLANHENMKSALQFMEVHSKRDAST